MQIDEEEIYQVDDNTRPYMGEGEKSDDELCVERFTVANAI